ncbi:hypothetical protein ACVILL_001353 [Bradyrhizobium sp. USDA 3364]
MSKAPVLDLAKRLQSSLSARDTALALFGVDGNDMDIRLIAPKTTQRTGQISKIRGKPRTFGG